MARIIGAIASSHTPTIGFALDRNKQDDPAWAPIFAAYDPIQRSPAQTSAAIEADARRYADTMKRLNLQLD